MDDMSKDREDPLLRAIVEGSDDAIITKTIQGVVTSWNPAAERIFGYSADEMIRQPITRIFPPERLDEEADFLRRLSRGERITHYETVRVHKDGRMIDVSVTLSPLRDASGRVVGASKIARDITERRRGDALLREREAEAEVARDELARRVDGLMRLAELSTRLIPKGELHGPLLDILDAGIHITGADMGNIQLRNVDTGHLEIAVQRGFDAEFLEFFATVGDDHRGACGAAMSVGQRVIVDDVAGHPLFSDTEVGEVLGRAGVQAVQSTPLWSRAGELVGMLSTHYRHPRRPDERDEHLLDVLGRLAADYIDRVRREHETDVARAQAEAADRAKDEFLAMLGHELRNPLGAIASAVGVLNVVANEGEPAERARAVIVRQVRQLSHLVDDLLDVSRVTAGKVLLVRRPLDLAGLVANTITTWRSLGRLDRHRVSVDAAPAWVDADESRVEQVLSNLVGNALKYTPAQGRVVIRVFPERENAVLEVEDTGIGIPPNLLPKVFDLFVQGDRSLDRAEGGLGLGLTLVKTLVRMHGGMVEARSDGSGKGSIFTVRLPAVPSGRRSREPDRLRSSVGAHRRVLLIEDNADSREMLKVWLTRAGHEVHDTADGAAGVDMARTLAPDVALIDVGLPELDGYEVARRIRAVEGGKGIQLIAITGYGQAEDARRALDAGFRAHLTKPIALEQLAELIARVDG